MKKWEKFEIACTEYLNDTYGNQALFMHCGGTDANVSDIRVETANGNCYYIEAKCCPAQCGQFVLFPNLEKQKFEYSAKNAIEPNLYAEKIISVMNEDFETFKNADSAGKTISFENDQDIFASWIKENYKRKNVKYIVTNGYKILSLEELEKAFFISAKYRIKKSGSSCVGKTKINHVMDYLDKNYRIDDYRVNGGKLFVISKDDLRNSRFAICGTEYMISQRNEGYEVRKLSNTFNANVIFSINLNDSYVFPEKIEF